MESQDRFRAYRENPTIEERNALVEEHLYMVDILIRKYLGKGVDYDDLYQVGALALVQAVERSVPLTLNSLQKMTRRLITVKSVSPAGSALYMTLFIKCPWIRFLLNSSDMTKAGMPIVNMLISDTCEGSSG